MSSDKRPACETLGTVNIYSDRFATARLALAIPSLFFPVEKRMFSRRRAQEEAADRD
ncbi:MAG: hypothetical protein ABSF61_05980 [Anaerolineales bacterium]